MKFTKIITFLGLIILMTACSPQLSPFTQRLYEDNEWSKAELKRIQFYLSNDVKLKRALTGGSSEITQGKSRMEQGQQIEEIVIPKGTPGVFVFSPKSNRFAVSFDEDDSKYLMFGANPKASNRYTLLASEWKRRQGKVSYDGKQWRVDAENAMATLLVDLKKVKKVSVDSRVAKGRRIGD